MFLLINMSDTYNVLDNDIDAKSRNNFQNTLHPRIENIIACSYLRSVTLCVILNFLFPSI